MRLNCLTNILISDPRTIIHHDIQSMIVLYGHKWWRTMIFIPGYPGKPQLKKVSLLVKNRIWLNSASKILIYLVRLREFFIEFFFRFSQGKTSSNLDKFDYQFHPTHLFRISYNVDLRINLLSVLFALYQLQF